jgi:hypothetical protein
LCGSDQGARQHQGQGKFQGRIQQHTLQLKQQVEQHRIILGWVDNVTHPDNASNSALKATLSVCIPVLAFTHTRCR